MEWMIIAVFVLGYLLIVLEHQIKLDKAASALMTGVFCWVIYMFSSSDSHAVNHSLYEQLGEIAGILFFLIGAMTIVELIDLYDGFQIIVDRINTTSKRRLLLIITILSFLLSAILDNLTTAIVMTSLIAKILSDKRDRMLCIGMIIIAANAGGAWSPVGDVTTTMLWIGNQITTFGIMYKLILPSIISTIVPLIIIMLKLKGNFKPILIESKSPYSRQEQSLILYVGLGLLIFVPIFKTITHLPPFMGMMLAVGLLWTVTEFLHHKTSTNTGQNSIFTALERVDMPSILFFMGILLAVGSLQATGLLQQMAHSLTTHVGNDTIIVTGIGLLSSIFDNVPLVAAIQGMYDLTQYPTGHFFWNYLAYCAGTGGSILIIGSAAGVAAMGIEKISFFWYLKNISLAALFGYAAGAFTAFLIG
jgi:Na+/H+ antiporter NhaD/arsenite permease-like protein